MTQVAVVDLGTNAMRLAIGSGVAGRYEIVTYIRYPNRLSEGMFSDGMLKRPAVQRTIEALKDIRSTVDSYKPDRMRLISTSVLRSAKNARDFLDLVKKEAGLDIEIISGGEEARVIHTGAVRGIDIGDKKAFVVDIGGGSTELSVGGMEDIELAASIESGAVRLKERFIRHDPPAAGDLEDINASIAADFGDVLKKVVLLGPQILVGVPGNVGTIYNAIKPENGLTVDALREFFNKLSVLSVREIKLTTGIEIDKADILLPGLMILMKIMEATGMSDCSVSPRGLLHGIIIRLLSDVSPS